MRKRSKSERSKLIREADALWRKIVLALNNGRCAICGEPTIYAHHIFAKSQCGAIRWKIENGIPLCVKHHLFGVHRNPELFRDAILEYYNKKHKLKFEDLKAMALSYVKIDSAYVTDVIKNLTETLSLVFIKKRGKSK